MLRISGPVSHLPLDPRRIGVIPSTRVPPRGRYEAPIHPGDFAEGSPCGGRAGNSRKASPLPCEISRGCCCPPCSRSSFVPEPRGLRVILSELCDPLNNYTTDRFIEIYNTGPGRRGPHELVDRRDREQRRRHHLDPLGHARPRPGEGARQPTTVTAFTVNFQSAVVGRCGLLQLERQGGRRREADERRRDRRPRAWRPGALFENADLVRNASITNPNAVFTPSEWTAHAVTLATDASPGTHNGSAPPAAGPGDLGTSSPIPRARSRIPPVDVQASVVDTSAAITAVTLVLGDRRASHAERDRDAAALGQHLPHERADPGAGRGRTIYYRVAGRRRHRPRPSPVLRLHDRRGGGGRRRADASSRSARLSDSTLLVFFSEPVELASARDAGATTRSAR